MLELDVPLAISALWEVMPEPDKVQEMGTVIDTWSTTESSVADAEYEANIPTESKVAPIKAPVRIIDLSSLRVFV